jgi:hypothetical protein
MVGYATCGCQEVHTITEMAVLSGRRTAFRIPAAVHVQRSLSDYSPRYEPNSKGDTTSMPSFLHCTISASCLRQNAA